MEEPKEEIKNRTFTDKIIDFLFSKDERKWLIPIFIIGLFFRILLARNISALGDEMIHGTHAIGFLHSGLISTILQSPLWFYLSDLVFQILPVTLFSLRFISVFYGAFSIILIYLISSKIFDKKVGLISAFLFSVSYYIIRYSLAEMDVSAIFFLLLAVHFFLIALENKKFPWLAAVCIGIAALIKTLSLYFVPAFVVGFFLFSKNEHKDKRERIKENIKHIIYFGLLIILVFSPIIVHNYLWYKDKGQVDVYTAQYFKIEKSRQAYIGVAGFDASFSYFIERLPQFFISMSQSIWRLDPVIVILGILGIISGFFLKEKRKVWIFLFVFEISGYFLLLISANLPTHETTLMPVICIFGGVLIDQIAKKIGKISYKNVIFAILSILLIFQLYMLLPHLSSQSALSQMRSYAAESMDKNSVVVVDARIYRGRIAFLFHDFHYLESQYFPQILETNNNLTGTGNPMKVYFIEAVSDDYGWGTIQNQPEFNMSVENLFDFIKSNSIKEKTFYGGGGYDDATGKPILAVYQTTVSLKPQIIRLIDSTHDWFYYPIDYKPKERIFDQYDVIGSLDNLIYKLAWLIIIVSIILAVIAPLQVIYELYKQK
jgi:hypothetical protein